MKKEFCKQIIRSGIQVAEECCRTAKFKMTDGKPLCGVHKKFWNNRGVRVVKI